MEAGRTPSGDGVRSADEKGIRTSGPGAGSGLARQSSPAAPLGVLPPSRKSAPLSGAHRYDTEKVNDTSAVPPVVTVTFWVWVPSASCHASMT